MDDCSAQLERWARTAVELLADHPKVFLHEPCPRCGARHAYHDSGGEQVRSWALKVSETGCVCLACGAFWGPERFGLLARLLGCDGVLTTTSVCARRRGCARR